MFDVEKEIRTWQDFLRSRGNFREPDIDELESHLREEMDDLVGGGLTQDEAFLVAVKRLGNTDSLSREFAKGRSTVLWKQLFLDVSDPQSKRKAGKELLLVTLLALLAGVLSKIPEALGYDIFQSSGSEFYRNVGFFFIPSVAVYAGWKHGAPLRFFPAVAAVFLLSLLAVNLYPFTAPSDTLVLSAIHLPLMLWLAAGILYGGRTWKTPETRMDFLRMTGEAFIYGVLILCGGAVLTAFTAFLFTSIGLEKPVEYFITHFLVLFGAMAAPVVAVYLSEAKRSIVESMAPVLAKVFAPLFLVLLTVFLLTAAVNGKTPFDEREYLIGFDLLLVLILAMVLYITASRPAGKDPSVSDWLTFCLIVAALVTDALALSAVASRIAAYGTSPNKVAALGENIFLSVNLGVLAVLYLLFLVKKGTFEVIAKFQTRYLAVYALWFAVVVFLFPVLFAFR